MSILRTLIFAATLLLMLACSQQPTDEEIRAIVRSEVMAAISEVKQGPPGEQGPLPPNEIVTELIHGVVLEMKEELRGPQGLRGEQGPPGARGQQGIPGTAQLSQRDRATLNRVNTLESDLRNLRSEVECEVRGTFFCRSSLHGLWGSTIGSRISSLEGDLDDLQNRVNTLESDLRNLRSEVECEVTGSLFCSSSLHGFLGSTLSSRISSFEYDLDDLQNIVNQLQNDAHRHTYR